MSEARLSPQHLLRSIRNIRYQLHIILIKFILQPLPDRVTNQMQMTQNHYIRFTVNVNLHPGLSSGLDNLEEVNIT